MTNKPLFARRMLVQKLVSFSTTYPSRASPFRLRREAFARDEEPIGLSTSWNSTGEPMVFRPGVN
jgi:hypothetical protein